MRRRSYAVWWNDGDGQRHAGKLELGPLHALLSGNGRLALPFDQITAVERVRGEILVRRRGLTSLRIGSLDAPGALREFAERLASRASPPAPH